MFNLKDTMIADPETPIEKQDKFIIEKWGHGFDTGSPPF